MAQIPAVIVMPGGERWFGNNQMEQRLLGPFLWWEIISPNYPG